MKNTVIFLCLLPLMFLALHCNQINSAENPDVLVITGGHNYDTAEFIDMFESYNGINFESVLKPEAWKLLRKGNRYDVMVFYDMWQEISDEEKELFLNEFKKGTGMVFMHHSLASHNQWPEYTNLVGGTYRLPKYESDSTLVSDYRHDIEIQVTVSDPEHPVTKGVSDFRILDEGYSNVHVLPGVHILLETNHPDCEKYIGWCHEVEQSKVVYLMGGHDIHAYMNESFRRILENAIHWTTAKQ